MSEAKFLAFEEAYKDAIAQIKHWLYEPSEIQELANWLMDTDVNLYSIFSKEWADAAHYTAEGMASLLRNIHCCFVDDGDITFVSVNGAPRIVFCWKGEKSFFKHCLTETELEMQCGGLYGKVAYDIKVLDIEPKEFGPLRDAYEAEQLRDYLSYIEESLGPE